MKNVSIMLIAALISSTGAWAQEHEHDRLKHAGEVMTEILNIPDSIPRGILDRSECVIVFPSVKIGAIGIARGAMSCRSGADFTGPWGPPALYALQDLGIGVHLGGPGTDYVLLVVSPKGVDAVLKNKVKLGADVSAAIGPKGRDAEASTDLLMSSEILTYSRSRGLFAGVSLEGSTLRQDDSANEELYGKKVTARDIVIKQRVQTPAAGNLMVTTLQKASPKNLSDTKPLSPQPR